MDFFVVLFLDTFECGKCQETAGMTKFFEYRMCLETGKTINLLNTESAAFSLHTQTPHHYI